MKSTQRVSLLPLVALLIFVPTGNAADQPTPKPTSPGGHNEVVFDSVHNQYCFLFNKDTLFRYSIIDGPYRWETGGTFYALKGISKNQHEFLPSQHGGISAWLSNGERMPWDDSMQFKRLEAARSGDTIKTRWTMKYNLADSINYTYRFHVSGRTLVIQVQVDSSTKATGFQLDRSDNSYQLRTTIVRIPYLTLFNLMYLDGSYVSMFFDWEVTNASELRPLLGVYGAGDSGHLPSADTSVWYAQKAIYNIFGHGKRNQLQETIYLTVSSDLSEVLPNIPGPASPMRSTALTTNVLSYDIVYPWSVNPVPDCDPALNYNYMDSLHQRGVKNLSVIFKNWNRLGSDHGYPNVLPANRFVNGDGTLNCSLACVPEETSPAGNDSLIRVRNFLVNNLGYQVALHQNYVDYYENAGAGNYGYSRGNRALDSQGNPMRGYKSTVAGCFDSAYVLKPSMAVDFLTHWSNEIDSMGIKPTWAYLDVQTSINPSDRVDYDDGIPLAGMFRGTLEKYRALAEILRKKTNGPVQGEGGNHFLYAGYFDDFEARIQTGDDAVFGERAPLLVDFDILKIRPKSALHGVGHYYNFYAPTVFGTDKSLLDDLRVEKFVATELVFAHGGLATKSYPSDHSLKQAVLEQDHVLPVYEAVANANPVAIQYWNGPNGPYSASRYIQQYPDYYKHTHPDFMSRVKVTYDNGVVVCVNRSSTEWDVDGIGSPYGWFTRNTVDEDGPQVGISPATTFRLKPERGWVVSFPHPK